MAFGVTDTGFVPKRLNDILTEARDLLAVIVDPVSGETLQPDFDSDDPLIQAINAVLELDAQTWSAMALLYGTNNPNTAVNEALTGVVQLTGTLRREGETDEPLRVRRGLGVSAPGVGPVEAIQSALVAEVAGVTFARVYVNLEETTDARGILPGHIAPVVEGGTDADVAQALLEHVGAGIPYHAGNTSLTLTDGQGEPYLIQWTRPAPVEIFARVEVTIVDASLYPANGDALIAQRVIDYAARGGSGLTETSLFEPSGFTIGEDVARTRLFTPANTVPGHVVTSITIGLASDALAESDIDITVFQVSEWALSRVTVVSVGG